MATIQGIYIALFGRPADPVGLNFWSGVTNNGSDLAKLVGQLTAAKEYTDRFTGMDNEKIINSIYQSLFGRDADSEGMTFFTNALKNGTQTIETIAINILDGAQGSDKALIEGKIAAADLFTTHLDQQIEIDAYAGNPAAAVGRDYITSITKDNPGTGANADAAILKLFALGGQGPAEGGAPGGGTTTPGGSEPTTPQKTFTITNGETGLTFSGEATGAITLRKTDGFLTGSRESIAATIKPSPIETNDEHPVGITTPVNADIILKNDLKLIADAAAIDGHSITGDGSATIGGAVGIQSVTIAVNGTNTITLGLDADNLTLEPSVGSDHIVINGIGQELVDSLNAARFAAAEADSQAQTLADAATLAQNNFNTAKDAFDAAKAAFDQVGGDAAGQGLADAKSAAQALVEQRTADNSAVDSAKTADDLANGALETAKTTKSDAQTAYDNAKAAYDTALAATGNIEKIKSDIDTVTHSWLSSNDNRKAVRDYLDGKLTTKPPVIPTNVKTAIIESLPTGDKFDSNGEITSWINTINKTAKAYNDSLQAAKNTAATTLEQKAGLLSTADGALKLAEKAAADTQLALETAIATRDGHSTKTDDQLNSDLTTASQKFAAWEAAKVPYDTASAAIADGSELKTKLDDAKLAVDVYKPTVESAHTTLDNAVEAVKDKPNDSMIHHEDTIKGFDVGHDVLHLPSLEIIKHAAGNMEGFDYEVNNGMLTITSGEGDVHIDKSNVDALLAILSKDDVIADGQTVAFNYNFGDNDIGLYVFQGHAGESDIGVKLVGLDAHKVVDIANLFGNLQ